MFDVLNAQVSTEIINLVHPQENSYSQGNVIKSGQFAVEVGWGCEATDGIITLGAGVLALSISIIHKILGLILGSFIIYVANLLRIISLYFILKYIPRLFDLAHIYVGQMFLIIVAISFFIFWAKACHAVISESPSE